MTDADMEAWVLGFDSWDVCDQVCGNLFEKTAFARRKIKAWGRRDEEYVKRAAFALIAGWDTWTIALLSVMGLVDYVDAAVHIQLVAHHSSLLHWYEHHIYNANQGLRLMAMLLVAAAMLYRMSGGRAGARSEWKLGVHGPDVRLE